MMILNYGSCFEVIETKFKFRKKDNFFVGNYG